MLNQAIKKIQDEIKKEQKGGVSVYVNLIGNYLIKHISKNPSDAEKIIVDGKTITGSLKMMEAEARKKKVGNMAILTPEEGFKIVFDYFGIKNGTIIGEPKQDIPSKSNSLDISLDDLL